jgi:multiple sugar transport system permease protein
MNCLPPLLVNLAGMLVIYCLMALALVRLRWRGRGIIPVLVTIIIAGFFWSVPTLMALPAKIGGVVSYSLWLGNWLVCGFGVVLLCQRAKYIPRSLDDSARMDGLGAFGTWRQVVLPFVRRDLGLIALFTLIATLLPFWGLINQPDTANVIVLYQRVSSPAERVGMMIACSLAGALIVIAIFLVTKRRSSTLGFEAGTEGPQRLAAREVYGAEE